MLASVGSVPEPASASLLLMALTAVGFRFRRACAAMIVLGLGLGICTSPANAAVTHRYTFNDNFNDSVGTAHATVIGAPSLTFTGEANFPGGGNDYLALPAATIAINTYTEASFETWFTTRNTNNWQRIFDFGDHQTDNFNNGGDSVFYAPTAPPGNRAAIANPTDTAAGFTNEAQTTGTQIAANVRTHAVVVLDADSIRLYRDGTLLQDTLYTAAPQSGTTGCAEPGDVEQRFGVPG